MGAWDMEFDFVSLGAGIGGITAAITAHDLGLSPVILEKSDQVGGVAAYSGGQLWVAGSHVAAREGIADSWELGYEYLTWFSAGTADPELLRRYCTAAPAALKFLEERAGVRWHSLGIPDNQWPTAPGSLPAGRFVEPEPFEGEALDPEWKPLVRMSPTSYFSNEEMYLEMGSHPHRHSWDWERANARQAADVRLQGSALAGYLVKAILDRRIPVLLNVTVEELLVEGPSVTGVRATADGRARTIRGRRATLIAVGGYDWNPDLVERFDNRTGLGSRAPRSVTGDHFGLVAPLDAELASVTRSFGFGYREKIAEEPGGRERWMPFYTGWPHAMMVDHSGSRLLDESGGHTDFAQLLREEPERRQQVLDSRFFAIFDTQYFAKYPIGGRRPAEALPDYFRRAGTLRELALDLGIDAAGLEATVARFNRHAAAGSDPDFGRGENAWSHAQFGDPHHEPNPNLGPIVEPPFYGIELHIVGMGITQTGIKTDDLGRVLNGRGAIPGLYAAGNSMAWRDLGANYHSGTANSRGMTWGYLAAQDAAGVELELAPAGLRTELNHRSG